MLNRRSFNVVSAGQCDLMSDKKLESHEKESHAMRVQQVQSTLVNSKSKGPSKIL